MWSRVKRDPSKISWVYNDGIVKKGGILERRGSRRCDVENERIFVVDHVLHLEASFLSSPL